MYLLPRDIIKARDWDIGRGDFEFTFGMDKQWGGTIMNKELYPASWDRTWWKIVIRKKNICFTAKVGTAL